MTQPRALWMVRGMRLDCSHSGLKATWTRQSHGIMVDAVALCVKERLPTGWLACCMLASWRLV